MFEDTNRTNTFYNIVKLNKNLAPAAVMAHRHRDRHSQHLNPKRVCILVPHQQSRTGTACRAEFPRVNVISASIHVLRILKGTTNPHATS